MIEGLISTGWKNNEFLSTNIVFESSEECDHAVNFTIIKENDSIDLPLSIEIISKTDMTIEKIHILCNARFCEFYYGDSENEIYLNTSRGTKEKIENNFDIIYDNVIITKRIRLKFASLKVKNMLYFDFIKFFIKNKKLSSYCSSNIPVTRSESSNDTLVKNELSKDTLSVNNNNHTANITNNLHNINNDDDDVHNLGNLTTNSTNIQLFQMFQSILYKDINNIFDNKLQPVLSKLTHLDNKVSSMNSEISYIKQKLNSLSLSHDEVIKETNNTDNDTEIETNSNDNMNVNSDTTTIVENVDNTSSGHNTIEHTDVTQPSRSVNDNDNDKTDMNIVELINTNTKKEYEHTTIDMCDVIGEGSVLERIGSSSSSSVSDDIFTNKDLHHDMTNLLMLLRQK
jgi:hypothetical protein